MNFECVECKGFRSEQVELFSSKVTNLFHSVWALHSFSTEMSAS